MGKITKHLINRFDGGATDDHRINIANKYALTKNFDAFTYAHKLVPQYRTVANEVKSQKVVKFIYAQWTSDATYPNRLYGYGVAFGTTCPGVFMWKIDDGTFAREVPINNTSAVSGRNEDVFFYYKRYIYMWAGGSKLVRFDTQASDAFNDSYQTISYTNVAQPVLHPSDDIAYFFTDNNVHTLNGASWTTNALVLPSQYKITGACAYGNYLAIACTTLGSVEKNSVVFLWDRDSSITTLSQRIDFGQGEIKHIANLNNRLVTVMNHYANNSTFGLTNGKIIVKTYNGNFGQPLNEFINDSYTADLMTKTNYVRDGKLFFPANPKFNGDTRLGIWGVDGNGKMTISFIEEEATQYDGIYMTGNIWWIAHSGDGSVNYIDTAAYSTTNPSVYESLLIGSTNNTNKLISAGVLTEPMPSAGQIVLKYRLGDTGNWITIYTDGTDSSTFHEAINIESSGDTLPDYHELQFQINSTGGAVVTGIEFKEESIDDGLTS